MTSFMKAINTIDLHSIEDLEAIFEAMEERYCDLEMQEPDYSYEYFYEKWEEKFNEFEYLKEEFEEILESFKEVLLDENEEPLADIDEEELEDLAKYYKNWVRSVEYYQDAYGGLKRLQVLI